MTAAFDTPHARPAAARPRFVFPRDVPDLTRFPARTFPRLFASWQAGGGTAALLGLPAVSGVFVAYQLAKGFAVGDRYGLGLTAAGIVVVGAVLGIIALWFAGMLPAWWAQSTGAREDPAIGHMFLVFSYATWPFVPLLAVLVPVELWLHGEQLFAAGRPRSPGTVAWLLRALQLGAIGLWLLTMVRGTAVARHDSERHAARDLLRWGVELLAIAVLFVLIMAASLMFW
jgi:hypothetical protein